MQQRSRLILLVLFASVVLCLGGCKKPVSPYAGGAGGEGANHRMGNISEEMMPGEGRGGSEGLDSTGRGGAGSMNSDADNQSDAYKREHGRCSPQFKPVYFDYDKSTLRDDQIPTMEFNGNYLRNNPSSRVLIEGNTDARGTKEYNLALGEHRAASAKKYLIHYGIDESRIRTISYGAERPLFNGNSEDDYAHNRRDDFILE